MANSVPLVDYDRSLEGKPLRYLIGADDDDLREQGVELMSRAEVAALIASREAPVTDAPWYDDARADIGRYHDGPDVPMLALQVAAAFPDQLPYARLAGADTEWCGIFVAAKLAKYGIRPPYTPPGNNVGSWMYADSWADTGWGTPIPVGQEQPGDVAVWRVPHHVNMVGENGKFIGGNQSNGVTETTFNRSGLRVIIRPPAPGVVAQPSQKPTQPVPAPVPLNPALSNFKTCLPLLLVHEGGNDDDPNDPGGRTSRGITKEDWDKWRASHPGLPSDVWDAPQDQVEAIYKLKYWDAMNCDALPNGVDYAVFDYGVNSGIGRAPKVLQRIVGTEADGEIGPLTIAATASADARSVINQICDERMAFLQGLSTWPTFGRGWSTRVSDVRRDALAMAAVSKPPPDIIPPPPKPGNPMPDTPQPFNAAVEDAIAAIRPTLVKLAAIQPGPTLQDIHDAQIREWGGTPPVRSQPAQLPGTVAQGTPAASGTPAAPAVNPLTPGTAGGNVALLGSLGSLVAWLAGVMPDLPALLTGAGSIAAGGTGLAAWLAKFLPEVKITKGTTP